MGVFLWYRDAMAAKRNIPHLGKLAISLIITISLVVPAAYMLAPTVHRWQILGQLTAERPNTRERALNAVIRRASDDAALRSGAIRKLSRIEDDANFVQLANALDLAGVWSRNHVPDGPWLRWVNMLATDADAASRILAAHQFAKLTELAGDERVRTAMDQLLTDADAEVRYNALIAAATLAAASPEFGNIYEQKVGSATRDAEPTIARHAWILLGLIEPTQGYTANWRTASPEVALAILWAATRTNPATPTPALEALTSAAVPAPVRAAAVYALAQSNAPAAQAALQTVAATPAARIASSNVLEVWRAILSAPASAITLKSAVELVQLPKISRLLEPTVLAAAYRAGDLNLALLWDHPLAGVHTLALLEGQANNAEGALRRDKLQSLADRADLPELLRVAVAASRPVDADLVQLLLPAMRSDDAPLRDVACVVAARSLDDAQNAKLIEVALTDYHDTAKQAGAILAGLTGQKTDLLCERAASEDQWHVQTIMRLGLWMRGQLPEFEAELPALLTRDDLPATTLTLALLHKDVSLGLDRLLAPQREPSMDLVELLDRWRWWVVVSEYLPEQAPPFWVWADPELQQFQIDVLRDWWLIYRAAKRFSDRGAD